MGSRAWGLSFLAAAEGTVATRWSQAQAEAAMSACRRAQVHEGALACWMRTRCRALGEVCDVAQACLTRRRP